MQIFSFSEGRIYKTVLSEIGPGWAKTSVNAPVFRKNSVVSSANYQFAAYYDSTANVVLARRKPDSHEWEIHTTQYKGNVYDAHNSISIMVDGNGYLHMSWDHHNNPLNYCRSIKPESLEMGNKEQMIGEHENVVSYPGFYRFENGNLLFAYRDGGSGKGNLVLNRYRLETGSWERLHANLIDGEGQRNAYWQMCLDKKGTIHVSWVWRETPDVRSNHDMCYACSKDGGITWENSLGTKYNVPITLASAEVVKKIPQGSNLINQTSMVADSEGNPYIATYFKEPENKCTQFYIIYRLNGEWKTVAATERTLDFEIGGMGSRSIPISRPQLLLTEKDGEKVLHLVYRDEEQDNNIVMVAAKTGDEMKWDRQVISPWPVDRWEPSYDTELMKNENKLHLFFQKAGQGQGEKTVDMPPQKVGVLEVYLK
ncbi:MAG: BNR repeat-containing protein [Prolixibacteraceae bacterium]|nr:BNR repeat-containing protein [Prolixibacteraceae bacterium]